MHGGTWVTTPVVAPHKRRRRHGVVRCATRIDVSVLNDSYEFTMEPLDLCERLPYSLRCVKELTLYRKAWTFVPGL